ncbi:MAG TPA: DUF6496 domain-containing protein [Polyangia bacterium]|jgi:hypothetical protein|nr:DUF6496 domain-containing protein [Polyangia bacterium]
MPEQKTIERARRAERQGKAPSTQAGEFVREEMEHVREGKHSVRSRKQAVAIGLSKARRAGVKLAPPEPGTGAVSQKTRRKAEQDYEVGQSQRKKSISAVATAGKRGRKTEGKRTPSSSTKTAKKRKTTSTAKSGTKAGVRTKARTGRRTATH